MISLLHKLIKDHAGATCILYLRHFDSATVFVGTFYIIKPRISGYELSFDLNISTTSSKLSLPL